VSTGDDEREHRKLDVVMALVSLFEQHGVDMACEMIDGDERLVECKGQSLGITDANQECAGESGTLGDGNGINGLVGLVGLNQRLADDGYDGAQVLARSEFRNNSAIGLVGGDLREDDVGDDLFARTHHRGGGLVAGALDAEDVGVWHNRIRYWSCGLF